MADSFFRLIVGLGNPPASYHNTPHNIGFMAVDRLAETLGLDWREQMSYALASSDDVALLKPETYMNTSGPAVKKAVEKLRVSLPQLLLVCDDFALPWGRLRFRRTGSSGGHNGLESVIQALGSSEFPRLRVGVGPVPAGVDPKEYVLKKHSSARMQALAAPAADALGVALAEGIEAAMNRFNAPSPEIP